MITYNVYLNGGKFLFNYETRHPLVRRSRIKTKDGIKFKVMRATRPDIISVLDNVPAIAVVRQKSKRRN